MMKKNQKQAKKTLNQHVKIWMRTTIRMTMMITNLVLRMTTMMMMKTKKKMTKKKKRKKRLRMATIRTRIKILLWMSQKQKILLIPISLLTEASISLIFHVQLTHQQPFYFVFQYDCTFVIFKP